MPNSTKIKVLFVCLGNICRSPMAQGVFTNAVSQSEWARRIHIDSAGTAGWHSGCPPDKRAIESAHRRGIDISMLRARAATAIDMREFDYVIAMDRQNRDELKRLSQPQYHHKISLLLSHANTIDDIDVPDPYYGGRHDFDKALDLIERAVQGLLKTIQQHHEPD